MRLLTADADGEGPLFPVATREVRHVSLGELSGIIEVLMGMAVLGEGEGPAAWSWLWSWHVRVGGTRR